MVKALVMKAFLYSADGVSVGMLKDGDERDIRDDLAPGLIREGFIATDDVQPVHGRKTRK